MKIPMAQEIEAVMDDDGNLHLTLIDAAGNPIAGAVLDLDQAEETIDDLCMMIEDFLDEEDVDNDSIGPCEGSA